MVMYRVIFVYQGKLFRTLLRLRIIFLQSLQEGTLYKHSSSYCTSVQEKSIAVTISAYQLFLCTWYCNIVQWLAETRTTNILIMVQFCSFVLTDLIYAQWIERKGDSYWFYFLSNEILNKMITLQWFIIFSPIPQNVKRYWFVTKSIYEKPLIKNLLLSCLYVYRLLPH